VSVQRSPGLLAGLIGKRRIRDGTGRGEREGNGREVGRGELD